jgi:hypothetical protein
MLIVLFTNPDTDFCRDRLNVVFPVQTLASHYFCDKSKVPAFDQALLRDSVHSIVTGLRIDDSGFEFQQRQKIYIFSETRSPNLGPPSPPFQWVQGDLSPLVKPPGTANR